MARVCYAADIGGTTVKCGRFRVDGNACVLDQKWQIPTDTKDGGVRILPDVVHAIFADMDKNKIVRAQVCGIGVGVPAAVTKDGFVRIAPNLGWRDMHVTEALSALTDGILVYPINDANAAALGEYAYGGGKGYQSMALLTLGTGVGGGIVLNGKVIPGFAGAAGEIGHLCVNDREKNACNCGNYGCLEQYSSATGIVRSYRQLAAAGKRASIPLNAELTSKQIVEAWLENKEDEAAREAVMRCCFYLGKACAAIACVAAPEAIVIGGGVSNAGEVLLAPIRESFLRFAFPACRETSFALARLGNDAGIYGCAAMARTGQR